MKRFFTIVLAIFAIAFLFHSCGNSSDERGSKKNELVQIVVTAPGGQSDTCYLTKEQYLKDSLSNKLDAMRDSMLTVAGKIVKERNEKILASVSSKIRIDKDEFRGLTFIEPKTAPKYRNRNGVYCYIATDENYAPLNLRFVFQYYSDEWLFIENMIFNIDGDNVSVYPLNKNRDCGDGGMIWEWCDETVDYHTDVTPTFISWLSNASKVKVKLSGSKYYDTKTLTAEQISSIKDIYELYLSLGGKF